MVPFYQGRLIRAISVLGRESDLPLLIELVKVTPPSEHLPIASLYLSKLPPNVLPEKRSELVRLLSQSDDGHVLRVLLLSALANESGPEARLVLHAALAHPTALLNYSPQNLLEELSKLKVWETLDEDTRSQIVKLRKFPNPEGTCSRALADTLQKL